MYTNNPIAGLSTVVEDPPLTTSLKQCSDPLSSYGSYLREFYTRRSQRHTSQHWTHLPQCEFIKLAMITSEQLQHGGPEEEIVRLAQLGQIETIMRHKKQVDLVDLLLPPSISPPPSTPTISHQLSSQVLEPILEVLTLPPLKRRVFLIEGAPGAGKSTLVLHVCHEWAQYAYWLQKFDIVVLAYLRDQAIQNASTLADILPADTLHFSQLRIHVNDVATQITNSGGVRVLFIFDGWDEFPSTLQSESLVSTIIREPHELNLQQSTVIITTRPVASGNLLHIADQRAEVLGFTRQQIREYIERALGGNNTQIQKLVQHLEEHPVIEGYCYIPLHVAILVHTFLTMKGVLPTTLHELFRDLVLCCIVREVETHTPFKTVADISSLDDLPDNLKSQLSALCVLAYEGVMRDEVVFYRKDLQAINLPTDLPSLGLLQTVEGLTVSSISFSYNFLHLSVQELLAAYHISQMNPSKQVEVFKEMLETSRFQAVLQYYSGITRLHNPEIQKFISTYGQQHTTFKDILPLLLCFFEAQQPSLCQIIDQRFRQAKLGSKNLNPVDYLAVGYFITSLLSTSTADQPNVHLQVSYIDEHCLKLLLSELSKYPFRGADVKHRLALDMLGHSITGTITEILAEYLKQSHVIGELSIVQGDFQLGELIYLAEALETNSHLTKLQLQYMNLQNTPENVLFVKKVLEVNKSLTHIDLSMNCKFLKSGYDSIFQSLLHNETLVHLNLSNTGITAIPPVLGEILQVNKSLTHLDLSVNDMFETETQCIFEGLQHNTTLLHLNLSCTGITVSEKSFQQTLSKTLHTNKTLKHLNLSGNVAFSDVGARCVFRSLKHNTTLVHLDLRNTGITAKRDIVSAFSQLLQVNKTLQHVNISQNELSKKSSSQLLKTPQ